MLAQLLVLSLALAPSLTSAALFPEKSLVKVIDAKQFKAALKPNMTSMVAFVAPWCGHCQRMAPEYSKAALGLYPLIPVYAVDCDAQKNKQLCAEQGVKGFPTVKVFPRGKTMKPVEFNGPERTASAFFYFASRAVPNKIKKIHHFEEIEKTIQQNPDKPRALLMNKSNKMPLLWSALANKYGGDILFYSHRDRKGKSSVKLGFEAGDSGKPKVLVYGPGETAPIMFEGIMKLEPLSKFFDSVLDGTADLKAANKEAAKDSESFVQDEEEAEIERQQEAEMLKLAHGGYAEFIDFEQAVKDGHGKDFHKVHGYAGAMGGLPKKKPAGEDAASEGSEEKKEAEAETKTKKTSTKTKAKSKMPATDEAGQIVMEAPEVETATATGTGQPQTPAPSAKDEL